MPDIAEDQEDKHKQYGYPDQYVPGREEIYDHYKYHWPDHDNNNGSGNKHPFVSPGIQIGEGDITDEPGCYYGNKGYGW